MIYASYVCVTLFMDDLLHYFPDLCAALAQPFTPADDCWYGCLPVIYAVMFVSLSTALNFDSAKPLNLCATPACQAFPL